MRGIGTLILNPAQLPSRAILEDDRTIFRLPGYARFLDVPQGKCNSSPGGGSENKLETTVTVSLTKGLQEELYIQRGCTHELASMSPLRVMVIVEKKGNGAIHLCERNIWLGKARLTRRFGKQADTELSCWPAHIGLGGGYTPIAGVLINKKVVDVLRAGMGGFNHAQTYQAHAVICATALPIASFGSDVTSLAEHLPSTSPAGLGKPATKDMYLFEPIELFKTHRYLPSRRSRKSRRKVGSGSRRVVRRSCVIVTYQ